MHFEVFCASPETSIKSLNKVGSFTVIHSVMMLRLTHALQIAARVKSVRPKRCKIRETEPLWIQQPSNWHSYKPGQSKRKTHQILRLQKAFNPEEQSVLHWNYTTKHTYSETCLLRDDKQVIALLPWKSFLPPKAPRDTWKLPKIRIKLLEFLRSKFSFWALLYLRAWEEHNLLKHEQHFLEHSGVLRRVPCYQPNYTRVMVTSKASSGKDHLGMESQVLSQHHLTPDDATICGKWAK